RDCLKEEWRVVCWGCGPRIAIVVHLRILRNGEKRGRRLPRRSDRQMEKPLERSANRSWSRLLWCRRLLDAFRGAVCPMVRLQLDIALRDSGGLRRPRPGEHAEISERPPCDARILFHVRQRVGRRRRSVWYIHPYGDRFGVCGGSDTADGIAE